MKRLKNQSYILMTITLPDSVVVAAAVADYDDDNDDDN